MLKRWMIVCLCSLLVIGAGYAQEESTLPEDHPLVMMLSRLPHTLANPFF